MKKCSDCIYYTSVKGIKDLGVCDSPTPYWAKLALEQSDAYVKGTEDGTAELCAMYMEDQIECSNDRY